MVCEKACETQDKGGAYSGHKTVVGLSQSWNARKVYEVHWQSGTTCNMPGEGQHLGFESTFVIIFNVRYFVQQTFLCIFGYFFIVDKLLCSVLSTASVVNTFVFRLEGHTVSILLALSTNWGFEPQGPGEQCPLFVCAYCLLLASDPWDAWRD